MKRVALVSIPSLLLTLACAAEDGLGPDETTSCPGGKCDDAKPGDASCDSVLLDNTGRLSSLIELDDQLVRDALTEGECPTTFLDTLIKLQETAGEECHPEIVVVSEAAQVAEDPADAEYRSVVRWECDAFAPSKIFFSMFGLGTEPTDFPFQSVEVISQTESGVFNYYVVGDSQWEFMGSSEDYVSFYDDTFDHGTFAAQTRDVFQSNMRCGACHTGGGMIMKELNAPWIHWERVPGAEEIVDNVAAAIGEREDDAGVDAADKIELGKFSRIAMDNMTKAGNRKWNATRAEGFAAAGQARALLRPLFCTVETNIISLDEPGVDGDELVHGLLDSAIDLELIEFTEAEYEAAKDAIDQRVTLEGEKVGNDTEQFTFTVMEASDADLQYLNHLRNDLEVIDEELQTDVLSIDFTRPLYSDERCGLLEHVPEEMNPEDLTPEGITEAIAASLEEAEPAEGTAEADLLTNLSSKNKQGLDAMARGYLSACEGRDTGDFAKDIVAYKAREIATARTFTFIEFEPTLPFSNQSKIPSKTERFHPSTCELVDGYVSLGELGGDGGGCLHIAEVVYDPEGSDKGGEWIKLYNACDEAASLDGMSLGWGGSSYETGGIDLEGEVGAGECFVVGAGVVADLETELSPGLQNSGSLADGVALFDVIEDAVDGDTLPLDAVVYGGGNDSQLMSRGGQVRDPDVPDAAEGASLLRAGADAWEVSEEPDVTRCPDF